MDGTAIRYALTLKGFDPCEPEDARYIVGHPAEFDAEEIACAQANLDADAENA